MGPVWHSAKRGGHDHSQTIPANAVQYPSDITAAIDAIAKRLEATGAKHARWTATQVLENAELASELPSDVAHDLPELKRPVEHYGEDLDIAIADTRYQLVGTICEEVLHHKGDVGSTITDKIDKIVLNRWLGIPIFLLVMYLMFVFTINVGSAFIDFFDILVGGVLVDGFGQLLTSIGAPGWLKTILADGVGGGIQTVSTFIPVVFCLFLFLSFLEDSGYMARAAFVMDRLMQALGLPGKSFVPLIVGFGCNVPSVMGARTLDAPRERLMTIMMAPFMSCGARLAIFAVFAAAFFGQNGALAVFSLYMLGIVMAVLTGLMLKYTIMRGEATPFVMELPVYHVPHVKSLIIQTWQRLKGFVLRAGKVIIIVSIFLSAFNSFSLSGKIVDNINDSALASVSRVITPVFKPIGVHEDNWQATVGLFTGAMAKEVVVGTLNTLYTAENIQDEEFNPAEFNLGEELFSAVDETWQSLKDTFSLSVLMNPIEASKGDGEMGTGAMGVMDQKFGSAAAAYSYLIFVLLYVPCISVMGAIARESSRGWMGFSILWGLNIAYSLATLFYQVASYSQHPTYSLVCILAVILFNIVVIGLLRRARSRVDIELLATRKSVSSCCAASTTGDCH